MNVIPFERSSLWLTLLYPEVMKGVAVALDKMQERIRPTRPKTHVLGFLNVHGTEGSLSWDVLSTAQEIDIMLVIRQEGREQVYDKVTLIVAEKQLVQKHEDGLMQEVDSHHLLKLAHALVDTWIADAPTAVRQELPMPPDTKA